MPWLAGTALLHSALVVERRSALVSWTILLGIVTFSLSLIGTFLVRSGVLTSVHAFAQDPARGVFILVLLVLTTGGALTLYAYRMNSLKYGAPFAPVSREGSLTLNNLLLSVAAATVFLGTFYPLIVDLATSDKISVGPPYYNVTFVPIMTVLLLAMAVGPALKWKRDDIQAALKKLMRPITLNVLLVALVLSLALGRNLVAAVFMGIAVWLVVSSLMILAHRVRLGSVPWRTSLDLLRGTPRAIYGLVIAHAGMGIAVAGITGMSAWATEKIDMMRPGQSLHLSGYDLRLASVGKAAGPNYEADRAIFDISLDGRAVTRLASERRFYPVRQQQTTAAGIHTNLISNLYVTLGDPDGKGAWAVRFYYHPFAPWIWLGTLTMAFGGLVSLSDRRLRVGVPQRVPRAVVAVPAE
jgi:cytochrome c-type biogenesis protein CcmF